MFTTEFMTTVLEECIAELHPDTEMKLHFARWAEYHDQMVMSEWPTKESSAYAYWQSRISRLRDETLQYRPHRLWQMVKDEFKLTEGQMLEYFGPQPPLEAE